MTKVPFSCRYDMQLEMKEQWYCYRESTVYVRINRKAYNGWLTGLLQWLRNLQIGGLWCHQAGVSVDRQQAYKAEGHDKQADHKSKLDETDTMKYIHSYLSPKETNFATHSERKNLLFIDQTWKTDCTGTHCREPWAMNGMLEKTVPRMTSLHDKTKSIWQDMAYFVLYLVWRTALRKERRGGERWGERAPRHNLSCSLHHHVERTNL